MVDISITAGSVAPSVNCKKVHGTAGATITQGKMCYKDTTDGLWKLADCTSATAHVDPHFALVSVASGQPIVLAKEDAALTVGATLAVGAVYVLSTAGGIAPVADLATADYGVVLGVATTAALLNFAPIVGGLVP